MTIIITEYVNLIKVMVAFCARHRKVISCNIQHNPSAPLRRKKLLRKKKLKGPPARFEPLNLSTSLKG